MGRSERTVAACSTRSGTLPGLRGAVVLMDLGSSVLSVRAALGELPEERRAASRSRMPRSWKARLPRGSRLRPVDRVDEVLAAAQEARTVAKF